MSKLTRRVEIQPLITISMLDNETLDEACDRFFNHLNKFDCLYANSYKKEYFYYENGNIVDEEGDKKFSIKTVVIVKHENSGAKYIFFVPEGKKLKAGDYVVADTKHGKALATCLCDSFEVDMSNADRTKMHKGMELLDNKMWGIFATIAQNNRP